MPLGGGVPAALGRYRRERDRGWRWQWRWRRGIGLYERAVLVDGEAAGWPGTEPRDWIPEMRQTDGTPVPCLLAEAAGRGRGGGRRWKYAMLSSIVAVIPRCIYPISSFSRPTAAAVARFLVSPSRSRTTLSPKLWDWSGVDALSGRNVADGHDRLFHFR